MNRSDKSAVIDRLRGALSDVPSVVVADFKGLSVEDTDGLRSELRKAGVHYEVVKNTLMRKAIEGTTLDVMEPLFRGNSAIAFHEEDPAAPAKILKKFAKENNNLAIKGGWVDGKLLDEAGVGTLATLPGKDDLRARFLSVLNGVPTKFVRTLNAASTTLVQVLQARVQQLDEG